MTTDTWRHHAALNLSENGVATLSIASAGTLNILGTPVIKALCQALSEIERNRAVKVVILRGQGDKAFVAGADISEMANLDEASAMTFIDGLRQLCEAVRSLRVPVICRLPGWCLGGGLELALACDLRIASSAAMLGMPEVKVGIPSIIHAALLPRLVGGSRAAWLLLTGEVIDAEQSLAYGLLNRVVAPDQLDAEISRVADALAELGAEVMAQQKRLMREWQAEPLDVSIQNGVREFGAAFNTGEPQKYMGQFLHEKAARKAAAD